MTAGIGNRPFVYDRGLALHLGNIVPLDGMDAEADPALSPATKAANAKGVQCGSTSAGIHFGLYRRQVEILQSYPFAPAERLFVFQEIPLIVYLDEFGVQYRIS
jgi:hypothetical protein